MIFFDLFLFLVFIIFARQNILIEMKKQLFFLLLLLLAYRVPAQDSNRRITERPVAEWGTMTFEELKRDPIWGTMQDAQSLATLDPNNFDISVEVENDFLYEKPRLHIEGNKIILDVHPKGQWCECLFPKNLYIKICSTQKEGAYDEEGKHYETTVHPIHIVVVKSRTWFPRCLWVIVSMIGLLLLFFYLRSISKKRRFKKNAMITPIYYNRYGEEVDDGSGQRLRKAGFAAWFVRWFVPVDEKNTLSFENPEACIPFAAAESSEVVEIPKASIDPDTMEVDGYDPSNDLHPTDPVKLANNSVIKIASSNGVRQGFLRYTSNREKDGAGYRVFLTVLMIASLVAFVGLVYLMIRSFM